MKTIGKKKKLEGCGRFCAKEEVGGKKYVIPKWCGMPKGYHEDGIGGCWGISYGYVEKQGHEYCKSCQYRKETYVNPQA